MRWYWQVLLILILGGGAYGGWYGYNTFLKGPAAATAQTRPSGPPPTTVETGTVRTGTVVEITEAVGTARAFESIVVSNRVAGLVDAIRFEEGQHVSAGDVMVTLDPVERRADMEQARAEIEAASAEIVRTTALRQEIQTRLERAIALRRTGSGTEAQVDDLTAQARTADATIRAAEARRRSAEARLSATQARLEEFNVRAPFPGRVGVRAVSVGAWLAAGTRITTLDDIRKVRVDFAVPENLMGRIDLRAPVSAYTAAFGRREFKGEVSVVDTRIDPATRTVRLTAVLDNQDEALRPGMFLNISLAVTTRENALLVPEEAVVGDGLRQVVFVVRDGRIDRRVVRIGQRQGASVEIVEGLQAGETIVVRGVQRVRAGMPVNARPVPTS